MVNHAPLVSFTFDDFPCSAYFNGGAILMEYGARGTFYTSLGLLGTAAPVGRICARDDLRAVLADGHELGCHTFGHCDAWRTSPDAFERSIVKNRDKLHELLPSARFQTLSYPIQSPHPGTKRRASRHFACCRGGGQRHNARVLDLNCVGGFFIEKSRDNPDTIIETIHQNARACGWLVLATHDVTEAPTQFGCTQELFEMLVKEVIRSGARILPVAQACEVATGRCG